MPDTTKRAPNLIHTISLVLLMLYILFAYIAQETLLPTVLHSLVMYAFIAWSFLALLCDREATIPYYTVWYLALMLFAALSFLWATHTVLPALYTMLSALLITFCIIKTVKDPRDIDFVLTTFVFSADIMGILLLLTGQLKGADRLGGSITGNANSFSALLMVSAVLAIWLATYRTRGWKKLFLIASILFILYLMIMSGGRKTLVAILVAWILFALLKDTKKSKGMLLRILGIAALLLALYFAVMKIPFLYNAIGERFEELFSLLAGKGSDVAGDETRKVLIEIGLEKWKENPFFGFGLDTFKYYNQTVTGHFYYAHNNYVEMLYDFGIFGTALYYGFILFLAYKLKKTWHSFSAYKALGFGLLLMLLIYDIGGVSYYTVLIQIVLCLVFVFANLQEKSAGINNTSVASHKESPS